MTGAEILSQVREALADTEDNPRWWEAHDAALAALDGCILLTREEADAMEQAFLTGGGRLHGELLTIPQAFALLTPDDPRSDIEWVESEPGVC